LAGILNLQESMDNLMQKNDSKGLVLAGLRSNCRIQNY